LPSRLSFFARSTVVFHGITKNGSEGLPVRTAVTDSIRDEKFR
jgi:hypothetical protein